MITKNTFNKVTIITASLLLIAGCGSSHVDPPDQSSIKSNHSTTTQTQTSTPTTTNSSQKGSSETNSINNQNAANKKVDNKTNKDGSDSSSTPSLSQLDTNLQNNANKNSHNYSSNKHSQNNSNNNTEENNSYNSNSAAVEKSYRSVNGNHYSSSRSSQHYKQVPLTSNQSNSIGRPVSIVINSISLDATIISRGLTNGILQPPPGYVEWYNKTVVPGNNGVSVLAGHVTYNGPDVFYHLGNVPVGAKITVNYSTGVSKTFTVYKKYPMLKTQLRYDQEVWGSSSTPRLAIITCDKDSAWSGLHHVSNYVLLAR